MHKLSNKQFVGIAGIIVISLLILGSIFLNAQTDYFIKEDMNEIADKIVSYEVEYRSERGFGNDRFDIYSYSLSDNSDFKEPDLLYESTDLKFRRILTRTNEDLNSKLDPLIAQIHDMRNQPDLTYLYGYKPGTDKLYMYSATLKKGFCLIFTI